MKEYIIKYVTKKDRKERSCEKIIKAKNAKQAREKFDQWHAKRVADGKAAARPSRVSVRVYRPDAPQRLDATRKFEVSFNAPDCKFGTMYYAFLRGESGAFAYGNRTSVGVFWGDSSERSTDNLISLVDTRYDHSVMDNFSAWCRDWLISYLDPKYLPQIKAIR